MTLKNKHPHHHEVPEGSAYTFALKWSDKLKEHTIHGLWPDMDVHPAYAEEWSDKILDTLKNNELITYVDVEGNILKPDGYIFSVLSTFWAHDWLNDHMPNEELWRHEFNKHGSRMPDTWVDVFGKSHQRSNIDYDIPLYFSYGLSLFDKYHSHVTPFDKDNQVEIHFYFDLSWNFITRKHFV